MRHPGVRVIKNIRLGKEAGMGAVMFIHCSVGLTTRLTIEVLLCGVM